VLRTKGYCSSARLRISAPRETGHVLTATNNPLPYGEYDVYCDSRYSLIRSFDRSLTLKPGLIAVNNEPWVHRVITCCASGQDEPFRQGIRSRDGRCVMTGVQNIRAPYGNGAFGEVGKNWIDMESTNFPLISCAEHDNKQAMKLLYIPMSDELMRSDVA
jgi:hypothetical protein